MTLTYSLSPPLPAIGLVALQADETIESELHPIFAGRAALFTSRVASGRDVSRESLAAMEGEIAGAACLMPQDRPLAAIAYACTSGAAQIGRQTVADRLRSARPEAAPTDPATALIAACRALGISRLALLSPYVEPVSEQLRLVLADAGIETPNFASFNEPRESLVASIDATSVKNATRLLAERSGADAIMLSCTNLRSFSVIETLEAELNRPVLSSNQTLAWHLAQLSGTDVADRLPGRLAACSLAA